MKKVTEQNFIDAAKLLGIEVATIKSVYDVESNGNGFILDKDGNLVPKILFEGHKFWEQLKQRGINPNNYQKANYNILYPEWTKKYYKGGIAEHARLDQAIKISNDSKLFATIREAALSSTSWGLFQIMGFNYKLAGFGNVQGFVNAMYKDEGEQLKAFVNFCLNTKNSNKVTLAELLKEKKWVEFAYAYNGKSYKVNKYDTKLEAAYNKYK
jgi:hypothetical protein